MEETQPNVIDMVNIPAIIVVQKIVEKWENSFFAERWGILVTAEFSTISNVVLHNECWKVTVSMTLD